MYILGRLCTYRHLHMGCGIFHCNSIKCDLMLHWIIMTICCMPYENASCMEAHTTSLLPHKYNMVILDRPLETYHHDVGTLQGQPAYISIVITHRYFCFDVLLNSVKEFYWILTWILFYFSKLCVCMCVGGVCVGGSGNEHVKTGGWGIKLVLGCTKCTLNSCSTKTFTPKQV